MKAEAAVSSTKKRYEAATAKLKNLFDKRDAIRNEQLINAVAGSRHSFEEIMEFIQGKSQEGDE